jgi:uncharacterized membrane protein YccF (DUF307 family)
MSVRDRSYENILQFIFGGIIAMALLYTIIAGLVNIICRIK